MATVNPLAALHDIKPSRADHASVIAEPSILSRYAALELKGDRAHPASTIAHPSMLSRIVRRSALFFFALVVGVGVTLAWQSYGGQTVELIRRQAPLLADWLPASTGKPTDAPVDAPQQQLKPTLAGSDQQVAAMPPDGSAKLQQQLNSIAIDLTVVKEALERLAGERRKITQSIDRLEKGEQEINQKISSMATPKTVVHAPTARPVHRAVLPSVQAPSKPLPVTSPAPPIE